MKKSKIFLPFVALALTFGLVACGNNSGDTPANSSKANNSSAQVSSAAQKEKIVVSAAGDKKTLEISETVQLSAKVGETALEGVTWSSSDAEVASVDAASGLVTAKKKGEATITAKKDGYTNGTITITVNGNSIVVQVEDGTSEGSVVTFKDSHNVDTNMVDAWPSGATLTLTFAVSKAGNYELHVFCRAHGGYQSTNTDVFADTMEIKVNGNAVTLAGQAEGGTFTDYKLADVALTAGNNTMTVKNLAADADDGTTTICTIDLFEFVPKA